MVVVGEQGLASDDSWDCSGTSSRICVGYFYLVIVLSLGEVWATEFYASRAVYPPPAHQIGGDSGKVWRALLSGANLGSRSVSRRMACKRPSAEAAAGCILGTCT